MLKAAESSLGATSDYCVYYIWRSTALRTLVPESSMSKVCTMASISLHISNFIWAFLYSLIFHLSNNAMCKVWAWQKPITTAIVSNRAHLSPQLSCFRHLQAQNVIITSLKPSIGTPQTENIVFLLIYDPFRLLSLKVHLYWDSRAISLASIPRWSWKISMLRRLPICEQVMLKHVCQNHFPSSTSTICLWDIFFVLEVKNPSLNYLYIRHPFQQVESIHIS